jgi:hypothetical protein
MRYGVGVQGIPRTIELNLEYIRKLPIFNQGHTWINFLIDRKLDIFYTSDNLICSQLYEELCDGKQ